MLTQLKKRTEKSMQFHDLRAFDLVSCANDCYALLLFIELLSNSQLLFCVHKFNRTSSHVDSLSISESGNNRPKIIATSNVCDVIKPRESRTRPERIVQFVCEKIH